MNHKRIQDELSAYLDNELTPSRHEQVEAHLRSCEECSGMLSAFQQNRQMVADLAHPVPSTLKDAVMAKIHTQFQDELSAYLDNELNPTTCQRVEAHLHSCSDVPICYLHSAKIVSGSKVLSILHQRLFMIQ